MIRKLEIEELHKITSLAEEFFSISGITGNFDIPFFIKNWEFFLSSGMGSIFVLDGDEGIIGGIGCIKVPDIITGKPVASEMFWYVKDGRRGDGLKLFDEFEKWADDQGCSIKRMVHLSNVMPDELKRLYSRRGYREVEIAYEKGN